MHVAHVITKLDVGGAQTHVVELAVGQAAAGYRIDIVAGRGGPAAERLAAAGLAVRIVPELGASHGRLSQRAALSAVTRALGAIRPDLVHGHSSNGGLHARLAARRLRLPSVYTAHGWPFQKGAQWRQRIMSFAGEFVGGHVGGAVIVLTEAERDRAARARVVPRSRLWVVPNGISDVPPDLRRRRTFVDGEAALVMVARFAPPKLQAELAAALAAATDVPWRLRFVGDGPELAASRAQVEATPSLRGRVEFLGHRDDVADILAGSDVGILWSRYEGLPISVTEYMRAGLCCVASDLPGVRALFGDEPAGLVVASDDQLPGTLVALLTTPGRLDTFGQRARARFESRYSVDAMVAATANVYAGSVGRSWSGDAEADAGVNLAVGCAAGDGGDVGAGADGAEVVGDEVDRGER
jgi:glycosyltransferase involved in cell wall biosynthesis